MALVIPLSAAWRKAILFVVCLLPVVYLAYLIGADKLGIDPVKRLVHFTGDWSIYFLILTFTITPVRQWLGMSGLLRYRRMLGLYAWFYTSLHLLLVFTYIFGWDWSVTIEELTERPYVIAGFAAWVLLVPMGLTSNNWSVRRLKQNWRRLHRLMYPVMLLAWIHIVWQARSSYRDAIVYGLIIFILFIPRLKNLFKSR